MSCSTFRFLATSLVLLLGAFVDAAPPVLDTVRVASGLSAPVFVTHAPNDFVRIFIVQQGGQIRILSGGVVLAPAFLNVGGIIIAGGEQGLLGLAFHPDYASNGTFFIYYTAAGNGANTVARYTVSGNPNVANAAGTVLLTIADPFSNHNGGWIAFGNDGYLYVATGDGGSGNDPNGNGQNINALLGKMLRIDVDGADNVPGNDDDDGVPGNGSTGGYTSPASNPFAGATPGRDEIWAYGLRNPWRNSFDRQTHDLYIGDVGQGTWEEVDFQPASSLGGVNYGWRCMEGAHCTGLSGCTCNSAALTLPIHEYIHTASPCDSLTGGYVYRGCAIPELQGTYFFADYCRDQIWSFVYTGGAVTQFQERTVQLAPGGGLSISSVSSFGEDAFGEMYICDADGGEVFKIVKAGAASPDCNNNSRVDACDILSGASFDTNTNGTPDECEALPPALLAEPGGADKNRYLSFQVPASVTAANETAIRVTLSDLMNPQPPNLPQFPPPSFRSFNGEVRYVSAPTDCQETESPPTSFKCASLQCTATYVDWPAALGGATLHVSSRDIVPSSMYSIRQLGLLCQGHESNCAVFSPEMVIKTQRWGDTFEPFQDPAGPNLTQPNIIDVSAEIDKFRGVSGALAVARSDIQPGSPDNTIDIADIASIVDAFKGFAYPFTGASGPQTCP